MNKSFFLKMKAYVSAHRALSTVVAVIILVLGYRLIFAGGSGAQDPKYVIAAVAKGTIVSMVSGTGQVTAESQISLTPKTSGPVTWVGVKDGQMVSAGTMIAALDNRDAAINLENAQIALQKLTQTDTMSILQAENAVASANSSLSKAYDDGLSAVDSTFNDLTDVDSGLHDLLYSNDGYLSAVKMSALNDTVRADRQMAGLTFGRSQTQFQVNLQHYKTIGRESASSSIESLIDETYGTVKTLSQAAADARKTVDYIKSLGSNPSTDTAGATAQSNLSTWISKVNSHLAGLLAAKNTLDSAKAAVAEKMQTLIDLQNGADPLDVKTQKLSVQQKQSALEDYYIRAPFNGQVANLNVRVGDILSSGGSIGYLLTKQKIATVSLNEVDVAKVAVGQKATLTFDAVSDLSITGQVAAVDLVGTVTQGVVNYDAKIVFDTEDNRIRPGMSASADIATAVKQDIVMVPNSAVKVAGGVYSVQKVGSDTPISTNQGLVLTVLPTTQPVEVGIVDDMNTEIISGLQVGDKIITRTISSSVTQTTASQAPSILGAARGFGH